MHRQKNTVVYVDFLFTRKKIKSKFMILLYSFYTKIRKSFLKSSLKKLYKKSTISTKEKSSNY